MKHRWMHIAGMLAVALVFALVLGACDSGALEVKTITTGKPNVTIEHVGPTSGRYGIMLSWDDVIGASGFEVWRSEGNLPMQLLLGNITSAHKDRFGRYVYYDIIDYVEDYSATKPEDIPADAETTLKSNTKYVYEVKAVPLVTTKDMEVWKGEMTTGTLAASDKLEEPTATITIDGATRSIKYTVTPPANYIPGIKTTTRGHGTMTMPLATQNAAADGWMWSNYYQGDKNGAENAADVKKDIADFNKGPWTFEFDDQDLTSGKRALWTNQYGSWRAVRYMVKLDYALAASLTNGYFQPQDMQLSPVSYTNQFAARPNILVADYKPGLEEVTLDNNVADDDVIITSVYARAATVDNEAYPGYGDGNRVVNLQAEVVLGNIIGIAGRTYTIDRSVITNGKHGAWEDVTASLMKMERQDVSTGSTEILHWFYVDITEDDLIPDIFGDFPEAVLYDRNLPVKNKAEYAYRIKGVNGDYVSSAPGGKQAEITTDVRADVELVFRMDQKNFSAVPKVLGGGATINIETGFGVSPVSKGDGGPDIEWTDPETWRGTGQDITLSVPGNGVPQAKAINYIVYPSVRKIGVLADGDAIELYFMRSANHQIGGFITSQRIEFRKADIESGNYERMFEDWINNGINGITSKNDIADYDTFVNKDTMQKPFELGSPDVLNGYTGLYIQAFVYHDGERTEITLPTGTTTGTTPDTFKGQFGNKIFKYNDEWPNTPAMNTDYWKYLNQEIIEAKYAAYWP